MVSLKFKSIAHKTTKFGDNYKVCDLKKKKKIEVSWKKLTSENIKIEEGAYKKQHTECY